MKVSAGLLAFALIASSGSTVSAAVIIKAVELGDDVVFAGFGSISLDSLGDPLLGGSASAFIRPDEPSFAFGAPPPEATHRYSGALTVGPTFGPGPVSFPEGFASSGAGDRFGLSSFMNQSISPSLLVPAGYVSQAPLSFSSVFEGATFDSLGIVEGVYEFGLSNAETIRLEARRDVAMEIVAEEIDGKVIISGRGAFELGAFDAPLVGGSASAFVRPDEPTFALGAGPPEAIDRYSGALTVGPTFGPGPLNFPDGFADAGAGDRFGLSAFTSQSIMPSLLVPAGYQSGAALESMSIWDATTFASLGITEGIYLFGLSDGQTIALRAVAAAPTAVPLPATAPLVLGAVLIHLGLRSRRRRDG